MERLPALNTGHLLTMTDDTGMLQHAIFSVPNTREGYTTDDNARALIVSTLLDESVGYRQQRKSIPTSRAGIWLFSGLHSIPIPGGSGIFSATTASGWKTLARKTATAGRCGRLGSVLGHSQNAGLRGAAGRLFEAAVPAVATFSSPRAWAFSILGMQAYLDWFPGDRAMEGVRNALANRLLDIYERSRSADWHWFEKSLSYSNARLAQALILAGWRSDNQRMMAAGIESLEWLVAAQHCGDAEIFVPIGSSGFFTEGAEKARFDQQPVEACATISACLEAYRLTRRRALARGSVSRLPVVPGQERSAGSALRCHHGRMPGRPSSRPRE